MSKIANVIIKNVGSWKILPSHNTDRRNCIPDKIYVSEKTASGE
jgi:hypothetical protein